MKRTLYVVCLAAAGSFAISPVSIAHGISVNHMISVNAHDNDYDHDRYRYSGNYFGHPYGAYGVNYYDSNYCYTPTSEQLAAAREQVENYFVALKKRRKHIATHRYISVETLRPTKKQVEEYSKKRSDGKFATGPQGTGSSTRKDDPSKTHCLMVYDTQTRQFVGSGCYLVSGEPPVGDISVFQTVSAEFVGQNSL
jgi:hypothetical protein